MNKVFVCESDLTQEQIEAECDNGILKLWRTDEEGRQWYCRELPPLIQGVPAVANMIGVAADGVEK